MKETSPAATAKGTVTGAVATPAAAAPTVRTPAVAAPSAAPDPVATKVRPRDTSELLVICLDSSLPARPSATDLSMLIYAPLHINGCLGSTDTRLNLELLCVNQSGYGQFESF